MCCQKVVLSKVGVAVAYVAGLAYWLIYFLKGGPLFTTNDWLKEQVFSNLIRESLQTLSLPWRMSVDFYHAGVYELIANPEVSLTPDALLLAVLPNNTYFLVHWLVFFSVGFVGTVLLAKKYQLSSLAFLFLVALFNFNGFIGSHLSEGHIQWAGCFLFSWFFYWLDGLAAESIGDRNRVALKIALLLGVMFLNGSFHMAIWCLMFLAITLLYRRGLAPQVGLVILFAGLMAAARLLPAAFYFPAKTDFVSGYPNISTLLDAFTYIYDPSKPNATGSHGKLQWHEYSFFIGYVGFVFLGAGAYQYIKPRHHTVPVWWIPAALVMFMFSLGDVYQLIPNSGIPFSTIERVGSRFIVMPFCVLLLIAAVGFTQLEQQHRHYTRLVLGIGLLPMLGEIFQYARKWRIQSHESVFGSNDIPIVTIVESHDVFLKLIVIGSWTLSLLTALAVVIWLYRLSRQSPRLS